ncbi:cutinase family protein [Streptomyces niveiscabiei]|uniref:cutinase family protein n=1 Tax=Streptomyces niveiscabiei TaxID=164115 RepID=UPI001F0A1ED3|nr:cutinase family protein [Streptomyces niveiscabiei]
MSVRRVTRLLMAALALTLLPLVAAPPAQAASFSPVDAQPWDQGLPLFCSDNLVIGARGSGENSPENPPLPGLEHMGNRVGAYLREAQIAGLSGSSTAYYPLPYEAADVSADTMLWSSTWVNSRNTGTKQLIQVVRKWESMCPTSRIGLVGYSQGANVVHDAIDNLSVDERGHIGAVLMLADPHSAAGQTSYAMHVDYRTGEAGKTTEGGLLEPRVLPSDIAGRSLDFCIVGDIICDPHQSESAALGSEIHGSYQSCCGSIDHKRSLGSWFARQMQGISGPPPAPAWNPGRDCGMTVVAPNDAAARAVDWACREVSVGTWYSWGGGHGPAPGPTYGFVDSSDPERSRNDPSRKGFDCSGFVRYAWAKAVGYDVMGQRTAAQEFQLPATNRFTAAQGTAPLQPGDLVFFGSPIHHVAMYLGDGKIVEARESDTHIMVSQFSSHNGYTGAIRLAASGGAGGGGDHSTWGDHVNVRASAGLSAPVVVTFDGPTAIKVKCQQHGESVTAEGYTNDAWSYLPDYGGWVSNIYVQGPAWLDGVPSCDGSEGGATGGAGRFETWATGVNVRPLPSRSGTPVATFSAPMSVVIQCQKRAESVTAEGLTNDAWSYLPDYGGWISNIYVKGADWLAGVPACDGNTGAGSGGFSTWGTDVNTRQRPSTSAPLGPVFAAPTKVTVSCQQHAESVTAAGVTNDAWSYLPDQKAWISNIFLQGPAWLDGVPPCGPSSAPVGDPGFSTWGSGVQVHADSSTSTATVHTFSGPTNVRIRCQERGESVTAEGITNSAWSYLPDFGGWVNNIYIQGPAWLDGVPSCGISRPGNPPEML